jgi:hypothetical protein
MPFEGDFVLPHQGRLSDGRSSLLLGDGSGTRAEGQPGHAGEDGARGHQHHFTLGLHRRDLGSQRLDAAWIGSAAGRSDEAAADLDHQPAHAAQATTSL